MKKKRILLVHGDRLLQKFWHEKLETGDYLIDVRDDLEDAENGIIEQKPDLILLDLVHRRGRVINFLKLLRAEPSTAEIPVLLFPTGLVELANAALQAGATASVEAGKCLTISMLNAVRAQFRQAPLSPGANVSVFQAEDFWVDAVFKTSVQGVNEMRKCIAGLVSNPPEPPALRGLWFLVHTFSQRAMLLPTPPLGQFLDALDLLMHDMNESPDQLNPSTLRTITSALDLLPSIADPAAVEKLADPSNAKILIVDDEPGALQFISAALHLAALKPDTAPSPAVALEKLAPGKCDLIFLDIGLPQVDGFELCTKIRGIPGLKTTPIVFITGMATFKNKATACLSGGNDFVGKPFNLCELGVKALTWLYRGQLAIY